MSGTPVYKTASQVANISLAGQPIVLDGVLQPVTDGLTDLVGALVEVKLNEVVALPGGGQAVRAARVTLIRGDVPVANVIIAESRLDTNGRACDPEDGGGPVTPSPTTCPNGSYLGVIRNLCVIREGNIVVGGPGSGPTGGTVINLDKAQALQEQLPEGQGSALRGRRHQARRPHHRHQPA